MASSSSSNSSGLSFQSSDSVNREPTPEHPPMAGYEALAPQWWDEMDWDFDAQSEDDEALTDGEEDLQFLAEGALEEESADDAISWGEDISSSDKEEESEEDSSSTEYPPVKRFRAGSGEDTDDDDEDEEAPAAHLSSSEDNAGSSADDSEDGGGDGDDDDAPFF
jgi:hypothetical protein